MAPKAKENPMQRLIGVKDEFDVAWACDPDHDRHGIVAGSAGLLNPNHYLAASISYLFSEAQEIIQRALPTSLP